MGEKRIVLIPFERWENDGSFTLMKSRDCRKGMFAIVEKKWCDWQDDNQIRLQVVGEKYNCWALKTAWQPYAFKIK